MKILFGVFDFKAEVRQGKKTGERHVSLLQGLINNQDTHKHTPWGSSVFIYLLPRPLSFYYVWFLFECHWILRKMEKNINCFKFVNIKKKTTRSRKKDSIEVDLYTLSSSVQHQSTKQGISFFSYLLRPLQKEKGSNIIL